ncbi:MAG: hypothetical protein JST32_08280 [Bacteroidetes bacterium]|nr:hypothetical protein [Bacteroidota bacterium]
MMPKTVDFMLISTNWDTVVDNALKLFLESNYSDGFWHMNPLHIHGSIDDESTLYLPTEVTRESYRTVKEDQAIGEIHGSIMKGLEKVERVVIYGLSLSPLDAELSQTLASGWDNKNLKDIFVIDPNHAVIAERVKILLYDPGIVKIRGLHPSDLDKSYIY